MLGIFRALPDGGGRLAPVDKKQLGRELDDPAGRDRGRRRTAISSRSRLRAPRRGFGLPTARVKERLGSLKSERAVSLIAIHAHGIPHVFPPRGAGGGGGRAAGRRWPGREDWRKLPLVTIDPADAKDHDDAVHAEPDTDPNNPGGFVVTRRDRRRRRTTCRPGSRARPRGAACAATRSISPTASCRCCRSASPTTSARCARARTAPRSRSAW